MPVAISRPSKSTRMICLLTLPLIRKSLFPQMEPTTRLPRERASATARAVAVLALRPPRLPTDQLGPRAPRWLAQVKPTYGSTGIRRRTTVEDRCRPDSTSTAADGPTGRRVAAPPWRGTPVRKAIRFRYRVATAKVSRVRFRVGCQEAQRRALSRPCHWQLAGLSRTHPIAG